MQGIDHVWGASDCPCCPGGVARRHKACGGLVHVDVECGRPSRRPLIAARCEVHGVLQVAMLERPPAAPS